MCCWRNDLLTHGHYWRAESGWVDPWLRPFPMLEGGDRKQYIADTLVLRELVTTSPDPLVSWQGQPTNTEVLGDSSVPGKGSR